ncbi:MAG: hypothetical protein FD123_2668 [Bacteroidetes bacterium]|nr:MAG: hypothetical protein FD123_2668 [Bacteroidota bacterium]
MNKLIFFFLALLLPVSYFAGDGDYPERLKKQYAFFALKDKSKSTDSVRFVVSSSDTLKKKKGIILFIQGSEPTPLFSEVKEGLAPPLPFDPTPYLQDFRFVVISKPGIPVYHFFESTTNFQYLDSATNMPPLKFLENDNLQWYTQSAELVLKYLSAQSWVAPDKIMVIGHSQGARVASYLCTRNKEIKKLAFLSCSAFARTYNFSADIRRQQGDEKQEQVQIDTLFKRMAPEIVPGAPEGFYNHHPVDDLLKLDIPVLLLYGLSDNSIQPETLDFVILEFTRKGKKNLDWKPMPGYDHNFFTKDQPGKPPVFHWDEIAAGIVGWMKK